MKQTLELRLGPHLAMTPQMRQAIRLLQLSTLELRGELRQLLESNYMLEMDELLVALEHLGLCAEPEEVEAVLKRVQRFEPPGVAARSLSECLLRQLDGDPAPERKAPGRGRRRQPQRKRLIVVRLGGHFRCN